MRLLLTSLFIAGCLVGAQSHASSPSIEKVKTGILPSGDLYSIYTVSCRDQTSADVASIKRGRRWCTSYEGELSCFKRSEQATDVACMTADVASTGNGEDLSQAYQ